MVCSGCRWWEEKKAYLVQGETSGGTRRRKKVLLRASSDCCVRMCEVLLLRVRCAACKKKKMGSSGSASDGDEGSGMRGMMKWVAGKTVERGEIEERVQTESLKRRGGGRWRRAQKRWRVMVMKKGGGGLGDGHRLRWVTCRGVVATTTSEGDERWKEMERFGPEGGVLVEDGLVVFDGPRFRRFQSARRISTFYILTESSRRVGHDEPIFRTIRGPEMIGCQNEVSTTIAEEVSGDADEPPEKRSRDEGTINDAKDDDLVTSEVLADEAVTDPIVASEQEPRDSGVVPEYLHVDLPEDCDDFEPSMDAVKQQEKSLHLLRVQSRCRDPEHGIRDRDEVVWITNHPLLNNDYTFP
ncbi:hypothetical protein AAC387_Pa11g0619 [Persea americana]